MKHTAPVALIAAALALGYPALACAQDLSAETGGQPFAVARIDRETHVLATLHQEIPQDTIALLPTSGLDGTQQEMLVDALTPAREAALQNALRNAVVASDDRPGGVDEDQVTLADYLTSVGIDPRRVVVVTVGMNVDRENPPVTIYYREKAAA
jgi:sulfur carrier protein ThiS